MFFPPLAMVCSGKGEYVLNNLINIFISFVILYKIINVSACVLQVTHKGKSARHLFIVLILFMDLTHTCLTCSSVLCFRDHPPITCLQPPLPPNLLLPSPLWSRRAPRPRLLPKLPLSECNHASCRNKMLIRTKDDI